MEPTNDVILSDQMTYDSEIKPPSYYKRFLSIKPQGAQNIVYSGTNTPIIFEISAGCHNLSKCELYFGIFVKAELANTLTYLPADYCSLFQSVRVTISQATQDLVYIRDLDLYSKMVSQLALNSQFRTRYNVICVSSGRINVGLDNDDDYDSCYLTANVNGISATQIDELSYKTVIGNESNTTQTRLTNFCLKLKDLIPDSIFSIDKTLWYDNVIRIELNTNIPQNTFFKKVINAASRFLPSDRTDIELRNLRLCYFTEKDEKAIALCKQLCSSCEMHIPLVIPSSVTNTVEGNNQLSYRLSRNPNDRLYKSYHALFRRSGTSTTFSRANCSNFFPSLETTNDAVDKNRYWTYHDGKWQGINCFELRINNDVITRFEDAMDYMVHINQLVEKTKNQHSLRSMSSIYNYGVIPFVYDTDYKDIFDYSDNEHKGIDLSENDCQINATFNAISGNNGLADAPVDPTNYTINTYENYAMFVIIRKCILQQGKFIFI